MAKSYDFPELRSNAVIRGAREALDVGSERGLPDISKEAGAHYDIEG
jgi:hypothetical protein